MSLAEPASRAAARAREAEYVRIVAAPTGDGVAAALLLLTAFRRDGVDGHVTFHDDLSPLPKDALERERCVFLLDGWSRPEPSLREVADRLIVLTHDAGAAPDAAIALTAEKGGLDGATEACAAALAYTVAHALDRRNADLSFLALAGAFADRQAGAGLAGLNASLLAEGVEGGHLSATKELAVDGPLAAALASAEPFLRGVGGRARHARRLAGELRLDPDAPVASFDDAERSRLTSALALLLLEQGAPPSAVDALVPTDAVAKAGPFVGGSARRLGSALDSAAQGGKPGAALAATLAGRLPESSADPLPALVRAEREPEKIIEAPGAAARAGYLAATYLFGGRPALAWDRVDGQARVVAACARESRHDVGAALRRAAKDRGVAAGHRLAARAVVPVDALEAFLADARAEWGA